MVLFASVLARLSRLAIYLTALTRPIRVLFKWYVLMSRSELCTTWLTSNILLVLLQGASPEVKKQQEIHEEVKETGAAHPGDMAGG